MDQFCEALFKDLHKHKNESCLGELFPTKEEINDALEHLDEWAKDEKVNPSLVNKFGVNCVVRKEPKGMLKRVAHRVLVVVLYSW